MESRRTQRTWLAQGEVVDRTGELWLSIRWGGAPAQGVSDETLESRFHNVSHALIDGIAPRGHSEDCRKRIKAALAGPEERMEEEEREGRGTRERYVAPSLRNAIWR